MYVIKSTRTHVRQISTGSFALQWIGFGREAQQQFDNDIERVQIIDVYQECH